MLCWNAISYNSILTLNHINKTNFSKLKFTTFVSHNWKMYWMVRHIISLITYILSYGKWWQNRYRIVSPLGVTTSLIPHYLLMSYFLIFQAKTKIYWNWNRIILSVYNFSWLCAYMAQMNPLIGPRLNNDTLIWIARTWVRFFYCFIKI